MVKVKTAIRLGVKSRFGITGFSTSDAILGLWGFSLTQLKEERRQNKDRLMEKEAAAIGSVGPRMGGFSWDGCVCMVVGRGSVRHPPCFV